MQLARFDDLLKYFDSLKYNKIINQTQNDFKIKIKNHTDDLKSRFKII